MAYGIGRGRHSGRETYPEAARGGSSSSAPMGLFTLADDTEVGNSTSIGGLEAFQLPASAEYLEVEWNSGAYCGEVGGQFTLNILVIGGDPEHTYIFGNAGGQVTLDVDEHGNFGCRGVAPIPAALAGREVDIEVIVQFSNHVEGPGFIVGLGSLTAAGGFQLKASTLTSDQISGTFGTLTQIA